MLWKSPGACPWSHAPCMTCQAKMCLMRRQHRWSPVFSQHVFQDFLSTFASSEAKRWEWVHESLQSPSIAEGGNAAESQGCALDTVAFRGHRGSTSGQARLETSRHSDPEMQPMKTRYDTIANLHVYGYTVTQYQHRDNRQVCKSKTWAQRGKKPKRKWNVSGQCLPNGKQSENYPRWTCKFSAGTWSRSSRFLFLTTSPIRCRSHSQGKDWPHPDSALFWQNCVCWAPLVLFLRHAGSSLAELWTGCGPGTS